MTTETEAALETDSDTTRRGAPHFMASGQRFIPDYPYHMVWLATNACNARCQHCSSNSTRCGPDELSTHEVFDMIDQLADAGVVDMAVSGGEPLLRHDLFEVIAHARRRGISIGVGTNGSLLTRPKAERLVEVGVGRLQVSLDGLSQAHDTLRRWPGLHARAERAIALAIDVGLRTHVCCTINSLNARHLPAFVARAAELGVRRINFSRYVPTGRLSDGLDLDDTGWRSIIERCHVLRRTWSGQLEIVTHLAQEALLDPSLSNMPAFIGCQAGVGQGCINAEGFVYPCVLLPIAVGNLRERPFAEIWRDAALMRQLRDRSNLSGCCGGCKSRSVCGGCRAVAYARTGDPFADDPRCWLPPRSNAESERAAEVPLVSIR